MKTLKRKNETETGTFLLRNLDKTIWARARAKAILDAITMTKLITVLLQKYVNDEVEVKGG